MVDVLRVGSHDEDRFDRSRRIGWLDLEAVSRARVLVIGAGAIGNEVGKDLALSGFRRMTIVDMDKVVGSNLNRCLFFSSEHALSGRNKAEVVAEGIKGLFPESEPVPVVSRVQALPESVFKDHDVVLGCLDNIEARVHCNSHSYASGKVYIDGGMEGLMGKVVVARPPDGACLQCGMNRSHAKIASLRFSCTGRDVVFHEPRLPAEITTTSVIAAIMVREALKVVSGKHEMIVANAVYYDGFRNICEELEIPLDPACPVHVRT